MFTRKLTLAGAALCAAPVAVLLAASPASASVVAASSGDVTVSNTETVQAYLNASGKVDTARVYEQIALQGKGKVDLVNPVGTQGLRNLDGFGGFEVKDGQMVGSYTVDGEQRLRTVSDYRKPLPLEVAVTYLLDGKEVRPGQVVGKSGELDVRYTVRNTTGKSQEVSFDDGTGGTATATEDVVIPMVGSLTTVLPSTFTSVASEEANMAGDGRGGTKLSFTMTLFGPIGQPEASFGYTARVSDGVVPPATISALPVSPLASPSFKGGAAAYASGAATGAQLTDGATQIDENLLKLRDGAGDLLAGLIKLRDGAAKLNTGLADTAAPGAQQLADGAGQLKDGTGKLSSGATKLDDGAGKLADGLTTAGAKAPQLIEGLEQVADGLDQVDAGLVTLHGGIGQLPAKAQPLHDGITQLRAGLGGKGQANTLIDGVEQVRAGFAAATAAGGSLDQLKGGVDQSKGGVDQVITGLGTAKGGVDQSKGGVDQIQPGLAAAAATGGSIDQLVGAINAAKAGCTGACGPTLDQVLLGMAQLRTRTGEASAGLSAVSNGLGQVSAGLTSASGGLTQVSGGLGQVSPGLGQLKTSISGAVTGLVRIECGMDNTTLPVCDATKPGLLQGLGSVDGGVTQLVNGVVAQVQGGVGDADDTKVDKTLRGGVHSLQDGVDQIGVGGITLLDGLYQLGDGAGTLKDGTAQLRSGAGQLDAGAGKLEDGAGRLATGLGDAADGSGQIADGLVTAADGAPKLQDGAQRLSDEGSTKLVDAGKKTAADYGAKYALIEAGAERATTEGMVYGAPEGASGQAAYVFELSGEDGEGSRNLGRGLGALAVFGLAGGVGLLRRRFV